MLARSVSLAALLAVASPALAQTLITGTVRDPAGSPLSATRLWVAGSSIGATSDADGRYRLVVPKGAAKVGDSLAVRAIRVGFAAMERRVRVGGDSVRLDFALTPVATALEAIVVNDARGAMPDAAMRAPAADRAFASREARGATAKKASTGGERATRGDARGDDIASAGILTAAVWDDLEHWKEYRRYLDRAGQGGQNPWNLDPSHATRPAPIARGSSRSALDLGFLVDATGSMGDEMQFLQSELRDIVTRVHDAEPELDIRISIVFYRDRGDEFVTRTLPFTRSVDSAVAFLAGTSAGGGGDYPEDMNAGFAEMMRQDWSRDVAPRMLFVIGDAPPQLYQDERYTYREAIREAGGDRIAMYPVAASGIDQPTEYLFRAMAAMTGGKYIFLTDDSGVGESHEKPDISGYEVEKLNELMVREIRKYVRGYLGTRAVAANGRP
ncbi:MAG TPA: carboxypeptidase regulatory-like domain-containing protein [Gemmatimonadaceae bacterium]